MSNLTEIAGYPVHAVSRFRRESNDFGVKWTAWRAQCGVSGETMRHESFETAFVARKGELCTACFPGRDVNACRDEKPVETVDAP